METFRDKSLLKSKFNYDIQITIPSDLLPDLTWWQKSIKYAESSFKNGQYEKTIYTDASDSVWGATDGINNDYGFWDLNQKQWHINYKELMVIKIALQKLVNNAQNCQILLRVDNMTAIAYVNKMGGTRFPNLHALAKEIWQWAERKNIFLFASYIPSRENVEADALSRIANDDTEWELADKQFNKIIKTFGQVDIDLFATNHNTKCASYCSRFPDPKAIQIDAFTFDWSGYNFYAFPPFAVIIKVLKKIKAEKSSGIVVVPNWPNQPWYPLFYELLIDQLLIFKPNPSLLLSPCRSKTHPRAQTLELMAGKLSSKLS